MPKKKSVSKLRIVHAISIFLLFHIDLIFISYILNYYFMITYAFCPAKTLNSVFIFLTFRKGK